MRSNERCRPGQTQALERDQVFVRGSRWISQRRSVAANSGEHSFGIDIEQISDERVGMLRGESVGSETIGREVAQVAGHDQVGVSLNGRGQNMNVASVRQIESGGACRVSRDNGIRKVLVHQRAGSFQYRHREIGAVLQKVPGPFGVDVCAP